MESVASNSPQDMERGRFEYSVSWGVRSLLSNLLRVARGAGNPHEIESQLAELTAAIHAVQQIGGGDPISFQLASALDFVRAFDSQDARQIRWHNAEEAMILGAMQIVASRLVDQGAQASAGHRQMFDALRELEIMRDKNRREVSAGSRRPRAPTDSARKR